MKISKREISLLNQIVEGGEGIIYEYQGDILKIYKNNVDLAAKERKVLTLIAKQLPQEVVAPKEAAYDNNGKFVGYLMPKVQGNELKSYVNKKFLKANNITTKDILEILDRLKNVVEELHKNDIYIGDLNDQNVLVDFQNRIYLIDCDSWSINSDKCDVVMDLYKDPQMKGNDFNEKTDTYALSILIWKTLTRIHPYGGTMNPDIDILERMKKGISVIDNPKIKIPRTIKTWKNLNPTLVESLKNVFENKTRTISNELHDMVTNLKFCDNDQEYYYGKFNQCPLCCGNAVIVSKPKFENLVSGLKLYTMLSEDKIKIVLNQEIYIDKNNIITDMDERKYTVYKKGVKYHILKSNNNRFLISEYDSHFDFSTDKLYIIPKRTKSSIYVEDNDIYYISKANTFVKLSVTGFGNAVKNITKCSYESYFSSDNGHSCIINKYDKNLIINIDGFNVEIPYNEKIINYGIHRDTITDKWLIILENSLGKFDTYVLSRQIEYSTDQIKYDGSLGNLYISNNTIYIPIDEKIRGYNYIKQVFKDFECDVVNQDSKLIKKDSNFIIINDDNIYKLGK